MIMLSDLSLCDWGRAQGSLQRWEKAVLRFNRIHLPVEGGAIYRDAEGTLELRPEHFYFLPNSLAKNFELLPGEQYDHLYIDFQAFPPMTGSEPLEIDFEKDRLIFSISATLASVIRDYEEGSDRQQKQVRAILEIMVRHLRVKYGVKTVENDKIGRAVNFIEENYREPIGNLQIADAIHVDQRHLIRLFTKHMNVSPYQYLTQCRIEHALIELRQGSTIAETAFACGYQSENAFRISFKKVMGCTPGDFIRQNFYYERIKA